MDLALSVTSRVPTETAAGPPGPASEESSWKNTWNWNLPDAAYGTLVLDIREGRVSSELRSQGTLMAEFDRHSTHKELCTGFNYAYRAGLSRPPATQTQQTSTAPSKPSAPGPSKGPGPVASSESNTKPGSPVGPRPGNGAGGPKGKKEGKAGSDSAAKAAEGPKEPTDAPVGLPARQNSKGARGKGSGSGGENNHSWAEASSGGEGTPTGGSGGDFRGGRGGRGRGRGNRVSLSIPS